LHDCNLHPDIKNFIEKKTGLLLVSGPTGSGKSTTLAALIEEINANQRKQIVVVESPIEYYFANRRSFIRSREVPTQTPSFEQAITDAMRENPDVLVIGEMRTPEVMRLTLNAAETGHLVIATMHSSTTAEALSRVCLSFPAEIQGSIRAQLADCLVGVVCQRLTYNPQLQLRIPLCEILTANSNAKASIRAGQFGQLLSAIQTGGEDGMWSFERYQRWIDQKKEWAKPSQAQALPLESPGATGADGASSDGPSLSRALAPGLLAPHRLSAGTPAAAHGPRGPRVQSPRAPQGQRPSAEPAPSPEGRLEINPADDDLEALARKISESSDASDEED
jgi:twitching motility protein PilT